MGNKKEKEKLPKLTLSLMFSKNIDLRIKIFNLLGLVGVPILIIMASLNYTALGPIPGLVLAIVCVGVIGLLVYANKTRQFQGAYMITVLMVFIGAFPLIFFSGGGYDSGMPVFFVFATVFTVYMLEGKKIVLFLFLELTLYVGCCIYAFYYPESVTSFRGSEAQVMDIIFAFVTVSIGVSSTMYFQFNMYQNQEKELVKARESAETANKAKSVFLASVSHEIRTPIHVILGMNEMIQRNATNADIKRCSDKINEASSMLQVLVNNVLDVAKIESGKLELILKDYRTESLIGSLRTVGQVYCDQKDLEFRSFVDSDIPESLYGDEDQLKKIITNLLSNAAKYTRTGSVTLTVRAELNEIEDVILVFIVEDTGIGIEEEYLPKLFDEYSRLDPEKNRGIEGTGLGLAIVKELCAAMRGEIKVESEYGKGSKFIVKIPQRISMIKSSSEDRIRTSTIIAPEGKVLIVDDNEENLLVINSLLKRTKLDVVTVSSGKEAIRAVKKRDFHVIFMDYMMPGLNGVDTFRLLKRIPKFDTPVVALTANAVSGIEQELLTEGFADFASKPIHWDKLEELIVKYLPKELVEIVPLEKTYGEEFRTVYKEISNGLIKYGINIDKGIGYFDGSLEQYKKTAELLCNRHNEEVGKVKSLLEEGDFDNMRFLVHALKGKAKNMGMERLSEAAAEVERLCNAGDNAEARSLMPYLFFQWERGWKGLEYVIVEIDNMILEEKKSNEEKKIDSQEEVEECIKMLPKLLVELRHKPLIACLQKILEVEETEEGKALLQKAISETKSFELGNAEVEISKFLKMKGME